MTFYKGLLCVFTHLISTSTIVSLPLAPGLTARKWQSWDLNPDASSKPHAL